MRRAWLCLAAVALTYPLIDMVAAQQPATALDPAAQKQIDAALRQLNQTNQSILVWEKEQRERQALEMAALSKLFEQLNLMLDSQIFKGENELRKLEFTQLGLIKSFEESSTDDLNVLGSYREALLQHGGLCVDLAKPVEARLRAEQVWEVHLKLRRKLDPAVVASVVGWRDEMATCLKLASIWLGSDRPQEAKRFLTKCENASTKLSQNPLKGELALLVSTIANTEHAFQRARAASQEALKEFQSQFPLSLFPHGHPKIAIAQCQLAAAHLGLEELVPAKKLLNQAEHILAIRTKATKQLHADVYRLLAHLNLESGIDARALECAEQSSKLYNELFAEFPNSHPNQITALTSLAELLMRYERAEPDKLAMEYARQAWDQCQKRFVQEPHKPRELRIATLLTYGKCLRSAGRAQLELALQDAIRLYPKNQYPDGHDRLAQCQWQLGNLLRQLGRFDESLALLQEVQASYKSRYPKGHPQTAAIMVDLGLVLLSMGNATAASRAFDAALREDHRQLDRLVHIGAEGRLSQSHALRQIALAGFLSATGDIETADGDAFHWAWEGKNVATRWARARRLQFRLTQDDPDVRKCLDRLHEIASMMWQQLTHPVDGTALLQLLEERDLLEFELGQRLPVRDHPDIEYASGAATLSAEMPDTAAFIEIVCYDRLALTIGQTDRSNPASQSSSDCVKHYLAFIVVPGQRVQRVELGLASPIDDAVDQWRTFVSSSNLSREGSEEKCHPFAEILGEKVWLPIAQHIPKQIQTLLLAIDGNLARFPFAAMPKSDSQGIILEDYAIATVPDGQFIREHRTARIDAAAPRDVLVVGDVEYGPPGVYPPLAGTVKEIDAVVDSEGHRNVVVLNGQDATVSNVSTVLPKMRVAFLGTHAYFDASGLAEDRKKFDRSIDNWKPESNPSLPYFGVGQRFPLSYIGLALSGANQPKSDSPEGGVLRGEAILNLDLDKLRLAVLSGCETGLGQHTAGEAVQGLQQAFHYAGCPNVVASLWKIDDPASAVFMQEYVNQLKSGRLTSLEALRQTQLKFYRDPRPLRTNSSKSERNPMHYWAAFTHSGLGASLPPARGRVSLVTWAWGGICGLGAAILFYSVWLSRNGRHKYSSVETFSN